MGSPIRPIIANMCMNHFQEVALRTVKNPPILGRRLVDNTFVVQWLEHIENFLNHINSIEYQSTQSIKFTVEDTCPDGSMPFLDTFSYTKAKQNPVLKCL